jgi:hypothetical protein
MSFWTALRWGATAAFVALVVLGWAGARKAGQSPPGGQVIRLAPELHR